MPVPSQLVCAILGHDSRAFCMPGDLDVYVDDELNTIQPNVRTLADLLPFIDERHSRCCSCGLKLSNSVWRADIPYGPDCEGALAWYMPTENQLLDCSLPLNTVFPSSDVPARTIHLVIGLDGKPAKPWPMALRGLRRLTGRLCRVVGSHRRLLPESSNFAEICRTPGCFYIESSHWVMHFLGGEDIHSKTLIPILRRPAGFGKTMFLTAAAGFFDLAVDHKLFPWLRVQNRGILRPLLVFSIDFAELILTEDMTDDQLHAECSRVMWAAAAAFYEKYVPLLHANPLSFEQIRSNGTPYGTVKALAQHHGHRIFLAIDNYTAPFIPLASSLLTPLVEGSFLDRLQVAITGMVLAEICLDIRSGNIPRGFITGCVLPNEHQRITLPLSTSFMFQAYTQDLTTSADCVDVIGCTRADIEALVKHVLRVSDSDVAARASTIMPETYEWRLAAHNSRPSRAEVVYPAGRVIENLRAALLDADADWDDVLHVPASESAGSAIADRILQTPLDSADAFAPIDK